MAHQEPGLTRLLTSAAFTRSRQVAVELADDAVRLRSLLLQVDTKRFGVGELEDVNGRLDVDIAYSVVEARVEELEEIPAAPPLCDLEPTTSARLRLVISALHYLVTENDAIHDKRPNGHVDDVAIVRWVTHVAGDQLPPLD
ncbi:hypothetical protein [Luteipulveratus mongoliensis]|uniref:Uncharacterized protein n=1 Tax=Luteipulveratus mongoliensis TaxID=571913 RepID=A0A0K1JNY2_9MICO|nr:hypothetical protein [Luteipulveratus mongoliensis]AKU18429.1 hypothetical protein VV02_25550 [Luteipulveratus mongoliensis]